MYSQKIYLIFIDLTFTFCFFKLELERKKKKEQHWQHSAGFFFLSWFILFSLLKRALSIKHPNCTSAGHWDSRRRLPTAWRLWSHVVSCARWTWKRQSPWSRWEPRDGPSRATVVSSAKAAADARLSAFHWLVRCRVKEKVESAFKSDRQCGLAWASSGSVWQWNGTGDGESHESAESLCFCFCSLL